MGGHQTPLTAIYTQQHKATTIIATWLQVQAATVATPHLSFAGAAPTDRPLHPSNVHPRKTQAQPTPNTCSGLSANMCPVRTTDHHMTPHGM